MAGNHLTGWIIFLPLSKEDLIFTSQSNLDFGYSPAILTEQIQILKDSASVKASHITQIL